MTDERILKSELDGYIRRTVSIRKLSSPLPSGIGSGEGYSRNMLLRSKEIESLSKENRDVLEKVLYPILQTDEMLSDEVVLVLDDFCEELLNPTLQIEIDLTLLYLVSERLLKDALLKNDDDLIITQTRIYVYACYNNMIRVNRLRISAEGASDFQKRGLDAAYRIFPLLEIDRFKALKSDGSRHKLLIMANFHTALYDTFYCTDVLSNEKRLEGMKHFLKISQDAEYLEAAKDFNWNRQKLRCLENMGQLTENGNAWNMSPEQCIEIASYMDELRNLWYMDPEGNEEHIPRFHFELLQLRNFYFGGRIDVTEYRSMLADLYAKWVSKKYDAYGVMSNLLIPAEYLATLTGVELTEEIIEQLRLFYSRIMGYIIRSEGIEAYSSLLDYLCIFLERFVDIPGELEFEQISLYCMAAIHPASYVHSMQVAVLSRCLTEHLMRLAPDEFAGMGLSRDEILSYAYHAGLLHDIGKISVADTMLISGRDKFETEKKVLGMHAEMSAYYLDLHPSTREYARVAAGHHLTDGNNGSLFAQIVTVSDRLDLDDASPEDAVSDTAISMSGSVDTEILSLLDDPEVKEDIQFLLQKGREDHYRNAYLLLRNMQESMSVDLDDRLKEMVFRTSRIRALSAPQIEDIESAPGYGDLLRQHFKEIGMLSVENVRVLEKILYPMLNDDRPYTREETMSLILFCEELLNGQDLCDYDQSLVYRISGRLLSDLRGKNDTKLLIRQLDIHISSCYEMMHQTKRMKIARKLIDAYREEGLDAARQIWSYLDKDKFALLDDECRELVLINARYAVFLYETDNTTPGIHDLFIDKLINAYHLADDPFYTDLAPDYDWNYHRIRALEYLGQSTECGNSRGFSKENCERIADMEEELKLIWDKDPETNKSILPMPSVRLMVARNSYYAGRISITEYRNILRDIHLTYRNDNYDFNSVFPNLQIPTELIISYKKQDVLSEEEKTEILNIYRWVIRYVFRTTNAGSFSLLLEYFSELLWNFIDLPGEIDFKQMCLYSMAALHPPTYIHSMLVGEISSCICRHMLKNNPSAFIGLEGITSVEEVKNKNQEIISLCHDAAMCHDFGKIMMIDTIFVYGRKLLDNEFALLKYHPGVGHELLMAHESTKRFADVALGHHKWYDDSRGYPDEFEASKSPYRILIGIVEAADCLDAATDRVGRSYSGGKRPPQILQEIQDGSGTRYMPEVADCLSDKAVREDIIRILDKVRSENYENTYYLLKGVSDMEIETDIKKTRDELEKMLSKRESFLHAYRLVSYDHQTICPPESIEAEGNICADLYSEAYQIKKRQDYISCVIKLHDNIESLDEWDKALVSHLYRDYMLEKNITSECAGRYEKVCRDAWNSWSRARSANDFDVFADALKLRCDLDIERVRFFDDKIMPYAVTDYDRMLDEYETGMTTERIDKIFSESGKRIKSLMDDILQRGRKIRTDFLYGNVSDDAQDKITEYLLDLMGFDQNRGTWGKTIHPFTERIAPRDTRVTTHYDNNNFLSNIYTVIHECGHALFEQLQPEENHTYHIADYKTSGQHESVSRFYENIIGRSESFIHLIYPKVCEVFPEQMNGVSERELYEAVNVVTPSLIRMDADELTYTLHIIIRYEIEKMLVNEGLEIDKLPEVWKETYIRYLGTGPSDDLTGVLQDVHWTDSFGYFPTYALGNFYGGMYLNKMCEEFDPFESLKECGFARINEWMKEHVFKKADRLAPDEWIRDITGRDLTAEDFLAYLERKYAEIYGL